MYVKRLHMLGRSQGSTNVDRLVFGVGPIVQHTPFRGKEQLFCKYVRVLGISYKLVCYTLGSFHSPTLLIKQALKCLLYEYVIRNRKCHK